ncbi:MAG: helix-turn-helix domain-containing protein [Candidatus Hodarchaeales archaeon]
MTQSLLDTEILKKIDEESLDFYPINKTDQKVLETLIEIGPSTRMELCRKTGIPRTTIYDSLTRLILSRKVSKYSIPNKSKGRPRVFYKIS